MTTKTILTRTDIGSLIAEIGQENPFELCRAIEQAVLQSEQVQAWKRDAERFRKVINMTRAEREEVLFFACDKDVINAIDAAMEKQP